MRTFSFFTFVAIGSLTTSAFGADAGLKDGGAGGVSAQSDAALRPDAASPVVDAGTPASDASGTAGSKDDASLPPIFGSGGSDGAGGTLSIDLDASESHDGQIRQHFEPDGNPRHASGCSCRLASNRSGAGAPGILALGALAALGRRRSRTVSGRLEPR